MSSPRPINPLLLLFLSGLLACPLEAQEVRAPASRDEGRRSFFLESLPRLGGPGEDRLRLGQLTGRLEDRGFLIRTPSTLMNQALAGREGAFSFTLLAPELRTVYNSELPFSMNDGALWAGRGVNGVVTAGVRIKLGPLSAVLAPQYLFEENRAFQIIPYPPQANPERSLYANPFYPPPQSMDFPIRFGAGKRERGVPGQSSVTLTLGPLAIGAATENSWWGPGIRNGILLSSNAGGIPRAFLRTSRPLPTPLGDLGFEWFLGRLTESRYFDADSANDHRTLNAAVLTFRPAFDDGLTLGFARAVFGPLAEPETEVDALGDIFTEVGQPNRLDRSPGPGLDQIFSIFGRWVFAPQGFEFYGEWARFEEPTSFQDFLEFPQHSQGYTLGFQWLGGQGIYGRLRVQAELTNLEPSGSWRVREPFSTYASRAVAQGYTERGQVVGAAIGPGGSSQWLAADFLSSDSWRAGLFGGRIRWNSAAWLSEAVEYWGREDVSLFWGFRGGVELLGWSLAGEVSTGVRINYLFQTFEPDPVTGRAEGIDLENTTVSVTLSKRLWR